MKHVIPNSQNNKLSSHNFKRIERQYARKLGPSTRNKLQGDNAGNFSIFVDYNTLSRVLHEYTDRQGEGASANVGGFSFNVKPWPCSPVLVLIRSQCGVEACPPIGSHCS